MLMLGLSDTIDQLDMVDIVCCYGHVMRRKDGHVLGKELDFLVEDQRKKGRPMRTWIKLIEDESMKVCLSREDVLCRSMWIFAVNQIGTRLR